MQPCELYHNTDPPDQQLFTAAAALFSLTGEAEYRRDADSFLSEDCMIVISNWNNVWGQGVSILAMTAQPDPEDVSKSQEEYRWLLGDAVAQWTACSEGDDSSKLCKCVFSCAMHVHVMQFDHAAVDRCGHKHGQDCPCKTACCDTAGILYILCLCTSTWHVSFSTRSASVHTHDASWPCGGSMQACSPD